MAWRLMYISRAHALNEASWAHSAENHAHRHVHVHVLAGSGIETTRSGTSLCWHIAQVPLGTVLVV